MHELCIGLFDCGYLEKYVGRAGVENLHRSLKDVFGFNHFREGQRVSERGIFRLCL